MRSGILKALLFTLLFFQNGGAEQTDDPAYRFTYYYTHPEPERVAEMIGKMSVKGWLTAENALPPIFGFLAGVFRKNPGRVTGWTEQLETMKGRALIVVALGLWYANLPDSKERVYAFLDRHPELKGELAFVYLGDPISLEEIPLSQGAWVLDALWGAFMATGAKAPVRRIIDAPAWLAEREDPYRYVLGSAARWSLVSNAVQHRRVLEICESEAAIRSEPIAGLLREIVAEAVARRVKSTHSLPDR